MGGLVSILTKAGGNNRGDIIASKRFDDDANPNTTCEWENKYFFYNYDMRGSTTAIIKPEGEAVTQYAYDEFGNLSQTGTASFLNEVTFTGSISDTSTGLQYMNSRYYDSSTGRFISQDTYTGNPYDPWTQNLYSYCSGNPTNFIDPTGHAKEPIIDSRTVYEDGAGYYKVVANKSGYYIYPLVDGGDFNYNSRFAKLDRGYAENQARIMYKALTADRDYNLPIMKLNEADNKSVSFQQAVDIISNNLDSGLTYTPQYNKAELYRNWDISMWGDLCSDYVAGTHGQLGNLAGITSMAKHFEGLGFTVDFLLEKDAKNCKLSLGQTMIAYMNITDPNSLFEGAFHYMKKTSETGWTHKYNHSAVMNFEGDPWDYSQIEGEYYFFGWRTDKAIYKRESFQYMVVK